MPGNEPGSPEWEEEQMEKWQEAEEGWDDDHEAP
jgi:hypothetical protein